VVRRAAPERWSLRVATRGGGHATVAHAGAVRRLDRGPALAASARDERDHAAARDQYAGYDPALDRRVYPQRIAANQRRSCRRKFDELVGTSEVAKEAIKRISWIYHVEGQFEGMDVQQRLAARDQLTRPLWKQLHVWLKLERGRVPDGGSIAGAIDYSLNSWTALTRHLEDGAVPIDNRREVEVRILAASFNPRPSSLTGEPPAAATSRRRRPGFNPRPSSLTGEPMLGRARWCIPHVSIRAHHL
jgi:hypothetical protein